MSIGTGQGTHISNSAGGGHHVSIDEGLYSRQLYVLGFEAMQRMLHSDILIITARGLGAEVAKNVALAGVRSITLCDPALVSVADLGANFFLTEQDIGRPRADACLARVAELNEYVPVSVMTGSVTVDALRAFQVVVLTDACMEERLRISQMARAANAALILANVRGLFASVFCDFGPAFAVLDATGEPPVQGLIASITADGIVTCIDDHRHGLEDGDFVLFRELRGCPPGHALCSGQPSKVRVLGPFSFSVPLEHGDHVVCTGGMFEQIKQPLQLHFRPFGECAGDEGFGDFVVSDFAKAGRQKLIFDLFNAHAAPGGDEEIVSEFKRQERGYLAPVCAVVGGIVAQEVIKACSGKFHPIKQALVFDALECCAPGPADVYAPIGSRYDAQIAVFGQEFQRKLADLQGFVVGAGAIGCELLKVLALMGVGAGKHGRVTVTDMDTIEKSNLNRQFLFRSRDVGSPKSSVAARAVQHINPQVHIDARVDRVGMETENVFNDDFFQPLAFVANALDNVDARRYVDRRCVYYRLPLLESGTLGTKGNTQVILPHMTESYSSSQDPPEKSIPFCTLHNFPHSIEHTIQWALDTFQGLFKHEPEIIKSFLHDQEKFISEQSKDQLEIVVKADEQPVVTFVDCVHWARRKFEQLFNNQIQQLLFNFPVDSVTSTGTLFWSGPKRPPHPLIFDPDNVHIHVAHINRHAI